jgi:PEP-CTERM motif-containing protein
MKYRFCRLAAMTSLVVIIQQLMGSAAFAAFASLNDWIGQNNTLPTNNYTVLTETSAGGTFQARETPALVTSVATPENWYLRDETLAGGPFGYNTPLSMSGKITVSNPNNADPSWFFGWYKSSDIRFRLGFGVANQSTNNLRMQAQRANGGTATSLNLTTDGSNTATLASTPNGTYDFSFVYTPGATNNLTVHIDPTGSDWRRVNQTVNLATANIFDRFGFLQIGAAAADPTTFGVTFSDINYTGETQVPEPAALAFVALGMLFALVRRRKGD